MLDGKKKKHECGNAYNHLLSCEFINKRRRDMCNEVKEQGDQMNFKVHSVYKC